MKRQATFGKIDFQIQFLIKHLYPGCIKNSQNSMGKKQMTKKKILAKDLNRHLTKEYLTNKHEKMWHHLSLEK